MCSLDGHVPVQGTTYQSGVTSIMVPELWRVPSICLYMEGQVERVQQSNRADLDDRERALVREWLQYLQHHS